MAKYRARWPLGTEARLMFDILHFTFLRLGDAARFGPEHLKRIIKRMAVQIATEKSQGRTIVTVPVHPEFAISLAKAREAGILGTETFTGKLVKGAIVPMCKKAWAAKFKKYARLAGVNEAKKNCHGVRKARAEDTAYAGATESQMMSLAGRENAGGLHCQGQPRAARIRRHGQADRVRSNPEHRRSGDAAGPEQNSNLRE